MAKRQADQLHEPQLSTATNTSNGGNSNPAKKPRSQPSSRTGQACERCKSRKMKCDSAPGRCVPCTQANQECVTMDRNTRTAVPRGYAEQLEQRVQTLTSQLSRLESHLLSMGFGAQLVANIRQTSAGQDDASLGMDNAGTLSPAPANVSAQSQVSDVNQMAVAMADPYNGFHTDNRFVGVALADSSSIHGTMLNIMGVTIDIANLTISHIDESDYSDSSTDLPMNKSYQSFVRTTYGVNKNVERPQLPPRSQGLQIAEFYLQILNTIVPILHRPSFMKLLSRLYDDPNSQVSVAEQVCVHMVFASMYFQSAKRNRQNTALQADNNDQSNRHYHYSLSLVRHLIAGRTLDDLQALTMVCAHVRNFSRPEISSHIISLTFNMALELGLHRSASHLSPDEQQNVLFVETRKKIFWSLLMIHVTISGKLGHCMPIRVEDMDIEIPEAVDDDCISETGVAPSNKECPFLIAIQAFKVEPIFMELYSWLHASHRLPEEYITTVRRLEHRIRLWREQWPRNFAEDSHSSNGLRMLDPYVCLWALEFRLLLRHPSFSMTSDANFNKENLDECLQIIKDMLIQVQKLQKCQSLDTTWYNCAIYVLAISTTLWGHVSRKDDITLAQLQALKSDMAHWLRIIGEIDDILGSGKRLYKTINTATTKAVVEIQHHLASKTARHALSTAHVDTNSAGSASNSEIALAQNEFNTSQYGGFPESGNSQNGQNMSNGYMSSLMSTQVPNSYQSSQFHYPEPPAARVGTYPINPAPYETHYPISISNDASGFLNDTGTYANNMYGASGLSFQRYATQSIVPGVDSQEVLAGDALMSMGGRNERTSESAILESEVASGPNGVLVNVGSTSVWPSVVLQNEAGERRGGER